MSTEKADWFFLKVALSTGSIFWLFTIASLIFGLLAKSGSLMAPRAGGITILLAYLSLVFLFSFGVNFGVGTKKEKWQPTLVLALFSMVLGEAISEFFPGSFTFPIPGESFCWLGLLLTIIIHICPKGGLAAD